MQLYEVPGIRINDSWYCNDGEYYYAFYLQYPEGEPLDARSYSCQTIGESRSRDMIHWEYIGTILTALPNTWNDLGIATGSTVKYNDKWYILYTGNSSKDGGGFGLAESTDLIHWEKVGDKPVIDRNLTYPFCYEDDRIQVALLADPYIFPEPFEGWYYAYFNAHIVGKPINDRAVQAIMKSCNLLNWIPHQIACRDKLERIETSQVWKRGKIFYMYGGTVINKYKEDGSFDYQEMTNRFYVSDRPDSNFKILNDFSLDQWFYIAKILKDPNGNDVLLANNIPKGAIGPYLLEYEENRIGLRPMNES